MKNQQRFLQKSNTVLLVVRAKFQSLNYCTTAVTVKKPTSDVRDHAGEKRVASDVERNAEAHIGRALVQLAG